MLKKAIRLELAKLDQEYVDSTAPNIFLRAVKGFRLRNSEIFASYSRRMSS